MNRAKPIFAAQFILLSAAMLLNFVGAASAQVRGSADPRTPKAVAGTQSSATRAAGVATQHVFYGPGQKTIPASMTRRKLDAKTLAQFKSRAPGDQNVIRQTILLSKLDPTLSYTYTPPASFSEHPFWTSDEKYIFFDSNRKSDTDPTPRADGLYNIFSMFPDGSGVTQIRTSTANEIEPVVAIDGATVAFVAGGTLTWPNGLDAPVSAGFSLYTYNTTVGGTPTSLTLNNPSGFIFSDVRHPTFNPGGTQVCFQGQLGSGKPYHLFLVTLQTDTIVQLTGPAPGVSATIESTEFGPAWSPSGTLIAYSTNASGYGTTTPIQATGINPANQTVAGDKNQYDIWVCNPNPFGQDPKQVTNSKSIVGGTLISSNKNPSWSTLNTDPLGIIPTNNSHSENLLAFASTRANADPTNPFQATAVKSTHDIYFLHTQIGADPKVANAYTVTTPESVGNAAIKLQTTSPGTTYDPSNPSDPSYQDPTFNFDPNFTSNEDNPTWPQYISSYRIAFQSDRQSTLQLWASTIIDIDAPTLLKYDLSAAEIVHVALDSSPNTSVRQVTAGETVRFRVRAVDYESGMESVWLQIKNPNSSPQSVDGLEHKIFYIGPGILDTGPLGVVNAPYELDGQAINPTTYQFRTSGSVPNSVQALGYGIPGSWPGFNQYQSGLDDAFAFSGGLSPVDSNAPGNDYTNQGGFWLQLWDDGPVDGSPPGHEPSGEIAGDGVFTASWTTPSALPSDWVLDVIVRDKALNPFTTPTSPNGAVNWKIYDNVWGFTTQPFSGNSGILYVNDYDCGQKFFNSNSGTFTNSGSLSRLSSGAGSFNGNFYISVPTEAWMTEMSPALIPSVAVNGTTKYILSNFLTTLGQNGYADQLTQAAGGTAPVTAAYDQWRVLCRGPVPQSILNAYGGHVETQPADVFSGSTTPRPVFVAERCVIWHAPYSGDLFVGPGTILDATTQVQLANFVSNGGRLLLNGNDILWGLTLGGGSTNALLSSTFLDNYSADWAGYIINANTATPPNPNNFPLWNGGGRGTHPIIMETWYNAYHYYPQPTMPPDNPPGTATEYLQTPISGTPLRYYSAPNGVSGDGMQWLGSSVIDASDFDATYSETGATAITWVTNSTNVPVVSKAALISFGLEALNPEYFTVSTVVVLKNRRAEVMHNVGDYLRTGRIVGHVRDLNGAVPVKGAFIRALSTHRLQITGTSIGKPYVAATGYTLADGSYVLDGLDANGTYNLDVFKAGYVASHGQGGWFHGSYQDTEDIYIAEAQAGTISGTVTIANTTPVAPAAGLSVVATDIVSAVTFKATTATDGTYTISNVPASTYSVTITLPALNYATCIPSSYGPAPAPQPSVVVNPGAPTTGVNFQVTQTPGIMTGTVTSTTANGNTNNVIPNATVTATDATGNNFTGITNTSGVYTINSLVPGPFTVIATASGYRPSTQTTVTISSNSTLTQNFSLVKAKPGGISGLVSTSAGLPVAGATVTISDAGGNVLDTVTTGAVQTNGNYTYNYDTGMVVPAGATVSVSAAEAGYTAVTPPANPQSVTITEATESTSVNFYLNPLNVFPSGLSLVSAPYDYTNVDGGSITALLGVPAADVTSNAFAFLTWNTANSVYVNSPTAPANTFHLGDGYFMQDTNTAVSLALATLGTPATANTVFNLPLHVGWNLIGDPWSFPINFLNLKVLCADGTTQDILTAQTGTNPTLGAALWGYLNNIYQVSYTLDPWLGYWLRVYDNRPVSAQTSAPTITLLVDPADQQNRSAKTTTIDARQAIVNGNNTGQGWLLNLQAAAGTQNSAPATVGTMRGALNTYDRFKLEAPPAIGKSTVSVAINHTDWGKQSGRYAVDLRPQTGSTNAWNFVVTSTVPNEQVTLTWPAVNTVSSKIDMILTDTDTNTTVNLRTRASYTMQGNASGVTRHLTISTAAASRVNLQIAGVSAIINSGRGAGTPTTVSVGYSLSTGASTSVSILRNGHVVRHLEQGVTRAAGNAQLLWDLKSDQGTGVPSDVYTIQVSAQDTEGHLARQVTPLVLVR